MYFLICSNIHDDVTDDKGCGFTESTKIEVSWERNTFYSSSKKIH